MLVALLAALASAAPVSVELPAGEPLEAWASALEVAELELAPRSSARIRLLAGEDWVLEVVRPGAEPQRVPVEAPVSEAARERITLLAASLLSPVRLEGLSIPMPPAPSPASAPPSPAPPAETAAAPAALAEPSPPTSDAAAAEPSARAATERDPAGEALAHADHVGIPEAEIAAPPAPAALPAVVDLDPEPAAPRAVAPWVAVRSGICAHPGDPQGIPLLAGLAGISVGDLRIGGLSLGEVRLGGSLGFVAPSPLAIAGDRRSILAADARLGAWAGRRITVGALGGVSRRTFVDGPGPLASLLVPTVGVEGGVTIPVAGAVALRPVGAVHRDLVPVEVYVGPELAGRVVPTTIELSLEVAISSARTRASGEGTRPRPAARRARWINPGR